MIFEKNTIHGRGKFDREREKKAIKVWTTNLKAADKEMRLHTEWSRDEESTMSQHQMSR